MTGARGASKPATRSWVGVVFALALGAGMPLLWMGFAPPVEEVPVADASQHPAETAPGSGPAVPVAAPAPRPTPAPPSPAAARANASAQMAVAQIPRVRDPGGDQSPDITDFINNGEVPTIAQVISRLHAAGVSSGLAAFNPPGTRPPLIGIAVSDDAALPPGYVRHHQVTDDGQRIEPILMFSPDHPLVAGAAQPQDRVVPPALVPPGVPIRHIVVPAAVGK